MLGEMSIRSASAYRFGERTPRRTDSDGNISAQQKVNAKRGLTTGAFHCDIRGLQLLARQSCMTTPASARSGR